MRDRILEEECDKTRALVNPDHALEIDDRVCHRFDNADKWCTITSIANDTDGKQISFAVK